MLLKLLLSLIKYLLLLFYHSTQPSLPCPAPGLAAGVEPQLSSPGAEAGDHAGQLAQDPGHWTLKEGISRWKEEMTKAEERV